MKTVCIITSVHNHDDVRIFHRQAKTLYNAGYHVIILCPDFNGSLENINFIKMPINKKRINRIATSWYITYQYARKIEADIYHLHDPELVPAGQLLKKIGKNVVYDAHEDIAKQILSKTWINSNIRKLISTLCEKYIIKTANKFDIVIGATETIAKKFNNGIVIYNFPDKEEFENYYLYKKYNLRENNVCYLGALSQKRGLNQMIGMMNNVDGKLILAGKFESLEYEIIVKNDKNYHKINYVGSIGRSDVWDILNESRIGMLVLENTPAYIESMPIKLFEYMMAGIPIIASDFPIWRNLIGNSCAIFVNNQNIDEISNAVNYFLKNPDIAYEMGQAGQKIAFKKYNYDNEKIKLLNAYKKIL